mmetsp:Transcript_27682/g.90163  ORF Transcript_27682/g.90163 Transcript_27682/m.90163 type:complete len:687 (+) Transcript_27682:472-2532(+)
MRTNGCSGMSHCIAPLVWVFLVLHFASAGYESEPYELPRKALRDLKSSELVDELVSYVVLVDAGSSGSRVHVFKLLWSVPLKFHQESLAASSNLIPNITLPCKKLKTEPGLSSFAGNPSAAGSSLDALIAFAKENVPQSKWKDTPFILAGTAGLRLLPRSVARQILTSCEAHLRRNSPFLIESSNVEEISGVEEGVYGWLSVNFLAGRLQGMRNAQQGTVGALEVGGASMQVTFEFSPGSPDRDRADLSFHTVTVGGNTYSLYTHSYLGLGQDEARRVYNSLSPPAEEEEPCFLKGYAHEGFEDEERMAYMDHYRGRLKSSVRGSGDYEGCRRRMQDFLSHFRDKMQSEAGGGGDGCQREPCAISGIHQPPFWTRNHSKVVVAFEHFRHTAAALNLVPGGRRRESGGEGDPHAGLGEGRHDGVTIRALREAARTFCSLSWEEVTEKGLYPQMRKGSEHKYCYSAVYLEVLLRDGLHVPEDYDILMLGQIGGVEIDWAPGMILAKASHPLRHRLTGQRTGEGAAGGSGSMWGVLGWMGVFLVLSLLVMGVYHILASFLPHLLQPNSSSSTCCSPKVTMSGLKRSNSFTEEAFKLVGSAVDSFRFSGPVLRMIRVDSRGSFGRESRDSSPARAGGASAAVLSREGSRERISSLLPSESAQGSTTAISTGLGSIGNRRTASNILDSDPH